MKQPQLIAFDLDGTVLDHNGQMKTSTIDALSKAHAKGSLIAVSTGRSEMIIPDFILNLPFLRYLVSASGAIVIDLDNDEVLRTKYIDKETALAIASIAQKSGAALNISLAGGHYYEWRALFMFRRSLRALGNKMPPLRTFSKMMHNTSLVFNAKQKLKHSEDIIIKIECVYPSSAEANTQSKRYERLKGIEVATGMGGSLEITAKGATKGEAIAFLCGRHGITKEDVMVFGDSGNDLSMRPHAGYFVAMGNATDEVKTVADYVTCHVDDDGVGEALRKLLKL